MSKSLLIVESPAKVKTIRKFLGSNFEVAASVGHIRDLPEHTLGVDEENGFLPEYQVRADREKVVQDLCRSAENADTVYLAPDPDREGEAIAWHIAEILKSKNIKVQRIQFNEITARAVKDALEHPRAIDENLVEAQQARRILDRLVGYKLSPLLWKTVKRGISAGRVQSVALRLIVDKEKERHAFKEEEYWLFHANVHGAEDPGFKADLARIAGKKPVIPTQKDAEALVASLEGQAWCVELVEKKERERASLPPFTTSTLQQIANQRLGYPSKRTMSIAQRLYEGVELARGTTALITYMRTDSTRISKEAREAALDFIGKNYGEKYVPKTQRTFKVSATAQDAHEAIRPVDVRIHPDQIKSEVTSEQYSLYKLIWCRFVASQMSAAVFLDTNVVISCGNTEWKARGQEELFDGWTRVLAISEKDCFLPKLTKGENLSLESLEKEQKFTQPPSRYTEASLVRALEELGIGRPSTYANIISTLEDRSYVEIKEKNFVPTDLGTVVCSQLVEHFAKLMDVGFTAEMEANLDKVAEGKDKWNALLASFVAEFNPMLSAAATNMKSVKIGVETNLTCPDCGKPLVIKFGKAGAFLACTGYPGCRYSTNFTHGEDGQPVILEKKVEEIVPVGTCPSCGKPLIVKKARSGSRFLACTGYPDCSYADPYSLGVVCPQCKEGNVVEKATRSAKVFYACSRYPDCDYASWNEPIPRTCPDCGNDYLLVKRTRNSSSVKVFCANGDCHYSKTYPSFEDLQLPVPPQYPNPPKEGKAKGKTRRTKTSKESGGKAKAITTKEKIESLPKKTVKRSRGQAK